MMHHREILTALLDAAIQAASPAHCLPAHLPAPPSGKIIILAAGKAAASMAAVAARHYRDLGLPSTRLQGLAVTRHGYALPAPPITVIEAGHPMPDAAGIGATRSVLALADHASANDLVLVLLSGGGSANWIAPIDTLSLDDKQALTQALLRSGATITEINCVRRHLSAIKGGHLARRAQPAHVVTLAISDVPGDVPEAIASGPTVADPTSLADARAILEKYNIHIPKIDQLLSNPTHETIKPGDEFLANTQFSITARPADGLAAAAAYAKKIGIAPIILGDALEGESWRLGGDQAQQILAAPSQPAVYISGGETTVKVRGRGRGGPNQEFVLGAAIALEGMDQAAVIAADTDGTDGGTGAADDPAGAIADGTTVGRARERGLDPVAMLANNDSTTFFAALGDLVKTGPTFTNINDFRAILCMST